MQTGGRKYPDRDLQRRLAVPEDDEVVLDEVVVLDVAAGVREDLELRRGRLAALLGARESELRVPAIAVANSVRSVNTTGGKSANSV